MLRIVFDVPRLKAKRIELEQISAQPEFWENQEEAKKTNVNT
jgi:peptide chain release factor 2